MGTLFVLPTEDHYLLRTPQRPGGTVVRNHLNLLCTLLYRPRANVLRLAVAVGDYDRTYTRRLTRLRENGLQYTFDAYENTYSDFTLDCSQLQTETRFGRNLTLFLYTLLFELPQRYEHPARHDRIRYYLQQLTAHSIGYGDSPGEFLEIFWNTRGPVYGGSLYHKLYRWLDSQSDIISQKFIETFKPLW